MSSGGGRPWATLVVMVAAAAQGGLAQTQPQHPDSAYAATQRRGQHVMGVDQYTSTHSFHLLPTGGRIVLQRDSTDAVGTATIRAHLRQLRDAFAKGDFSMPAATHARDVPGTATMAARPTLITYRMRALPGGGELLIATRDTAALRAIGEFIRFQRDDHRAGGTDSAMIRMHQMHHPKP